MVLESLVNPLKAEREPWELFFVGFIYASVGVVLGLWVFREYASLVMVFLTSLACVPLLYNTIKAEEQKDLEIKKESVLLKEHGKAVSFFIFLFLGVVVAYTLWYVFLPADLTQTLFNVQSQTISQINKHISGSVVQPDVFWKIVFNNIRVLIFCILFSFIFGAGAIFILTWNASVIGAAMGNFARSGLSNGASYFQIAPLSLLRYILHGLPEIGGYFIGALAGGIISVAVIRQDFKSKNFDRVLFDSCGLLLIAIILLFLGAYIEVYITPIFFR